MAVDNGNPILKQTIVITEAMSDWLGAVTHGFIMYISKPSDHGVSCVDGEDNAISYVLNTSHALTSHVGVEAVMEIDLTQEIAAYPITITWTAP